MIFAAPSGAVTASKPVVAPVGFPDPMDEVIAAATAQLHAIEDAAAELQAQVGAYLAAVTEAEYLAAHPPVEARSVTVASAPTGGATGECGGATNGADQFIARESHGQADVWNTQGSGAWGCYQIMPATWASSCSDLGAHGSAPASAQAECASRLPLSAWGG